MSVSRIFKVSQLREWLRRVLRRGAVDSARMITEDVFVELFVTRLEPRIVLNADFTLVGGALGDVLNLTNFDGATTEVTVEESVDGSDYVFRLDDGTWNGDSSPAGIDVAGDTLTVDKALVTEAIHIDDAAAGSDVDVTFDNLDFSTPTVAGSVLDVDNVETIRVSGSIVTDSADLHLDADRNIVLNPGSSITTTDGDVKLIANASVTANGDGTFVITAGTTSGIFVGIDVNGAAISTSGSGSILLAGASGDDPGTADHDGVKIYGGSDITSIQQTDGGGGITIWGQSRDGLNSSSGVEISGSGTTVTSYTGDIDIDGFTGGTGSFSRGVQISSGARIESLGTAFDAGTGDSLAATIDIHGESTAAGFANQGVQVESSGSLIQAINGSIRITGVGSP
ncbi:MAG: hypothetical protein KDA89_23890, partial [Planctomycetaceae bacterium]|nr:hypothetical protein [Planctomycetaceae bacterium]